MIALNEKMTREVSYLVRNIQGIMSNSEVAEELGLSIRTIQRKKRRYQLLGEEGLRHRLSNRPGNRAFKEATLEKISYFLQNKYLNKTKNITHISELLLENESIKVSRKTINRLIKARQLITGNEIIHKKHYAFRTPRSRFGELIQLDTSIHEWFGGIKTNLIVAIDDATSQIVHAEFFEHDGTLSNFKVLFSIIQKHGKPMAFYTDKASWFHINPKNESLGSRNNVLHVKIRKEGKTQWEEVLSNLGIKAIVAHSSQAKGRVERSNRTLQDRLVTELKLKDIKDIHSANEYLLKTYIIKHNKIFARKAASDQIAFIKTNKSEGDLKNIISKVYHSVIRNDNTIYLQKGNIFFQVEKTNKRENWSRVPVIIKVNIDHKISIFHMNTMEEIPFTIIRYQPFKERKYSYNELDDENSVESVA